jgi:glycosyltransferase involved in cell wall biosynthesis
MIPIKAMHRVAGIIVNMVPYHHARWEAFAATTGNETHLLELTGRDEFRVLEFSSKSRYRRHTLFPSTGASRAEIRKAVADRLDALRPEVICVSGWGLAVSLAAMEWASRNGVPVVMMSESNEFDESRSLLKEFIKRRLVGLCASGLAGGTPQADYLVKLGFPGERVFTGYDVVDNGFFSEGVRKIVENQALGKGCGRLPKVAPVGRHSPPEEGAVNQGSRVEGEEGIANWPYFFACARFGKKKNLPGMIRAYAQYQKKVERRGTRVESQTQQSINNEQPSPWELVIAGEGGERSLIEQTIRDYGVADHVHLVGPKGYGELPSYYAHASAFIHASTTEQWGLVVNEAMAAGLPVLVSNRCGCAADLVKDGENGWTFDPKNEDEMADLMLKISGDEEQRREMGRKSREIIENWGPARFASGLSSAIEAALSAPKKKTGLIDRLILWAMTRK